VRHASRFVLSIAAGALLAAFAARAAPAAIAAQDGQAAGLPDNPSTALFVRVCSDCHALERTITRRRTRAEWTDTMRQMLEDGAEVTDEEVAVLIDYLVSNFGAVAINTATADVLATVLGLSGREAEAIVAHRAANGNFANFEAVKKVPDVDITKLERRKDSIRF
jgi:competence ComEA-like helix-hairpin-helix protein